LVAKYADEWNCVNMQPETYQHKLNVLTDPCNDLGRDISTVHQSMMAFGLVADDEQTLDRFTKFHVNQMGATGSPAAYRKAKATKGNWIVGLTNEVVDKLGKFASMGLEEVQLQHFNFASDEVPEYLADGIAPRVAGL
jgi:alkanesulfonate monooxygenase SsuD/methylene tetrahydromethanopterin reductase-like flavin-dependent oxidoreductase (luciferase family)